MARYLKILKNLQSNDWRVRRAAVSHHSAQLVHLRKAVNDSSIEVRMAVYSHPKATEDLVDRGLFGEKDLLCRVGAIRENFDRLTSRQVNALLREPNLKEHIPMLRWHSLRDIAYACTQLITHEGSKKFTMDYDHLRKLVLTVFMESTK